MSLGGALQEGDSKLFSGPLGVVKLAFKGYDLGKTTDATTLSPEQDVKDILYQQDGTKPADHVRTGLELIVTASFGEIKTSLLALLMSGLSSVNADADSDSGVFGRNVYQSMRDNEAGALKVASVNASGVASEELADILHFYEAIPIINGDLINWGADVQRNLPVQFRIKYHEFADGESSTLDGAFGYFGDPTVEDVPALEWPDVGGPELLSAEVTAATEIDLTFNEDVAVVGGAYVSGTLFAKVDGVFIEATALSATDAVITATFPASSFASGDTVRLYATNGCVEDTETTPNAWLGEDAYVVTNNL